PALSRRPALGQPVTNAPRRAHVEVTITRHTAIERQRIRDVRRHIVLQRLGESRASSVGRHVTLAHVFPVLGSLLHSVRSDPQRLFRNGDHPLDPLPFPDPHPTTVHRSAFLLGSILPPH